MRPHDAIEAQIELLREELIRCRKTIDSTGIDAKFRGRVAARFDKEVTRLEASNAALKAKVTSGQPLNACWRELRKVQRDSSRVFDECLAFIQGALARKAELDGGICALTDDLLDDLAHLSDVLWGRFTLLATSEFYRETAEIIRVRFPEVSLWSIPLAAHEFGHYVGPELRESQDGVGIYPFKVLLETSDKTRQAPLHTQQWYHLQEHFSDLFATYTLGPAYAAAFILLRMNPSEANTATLTHPSGSRRVHGILWTLEKVDELAPSPMQRAFRDVTPLLRDVWQQSLRQVGAPETLAPAEGALVAQQMNELFGLLVNAMPQRVALGRGDWLRVEQLAADLAPATLPEQLTRRDVLNAAWLSRLRAADPNPYVLNEIAREALATYRRLSSGKQKAAGAGAC
jgi:hypothetical protein